MKFDAYHPAINFIFFTLVLTAALRFNQPFFLAVSYLCPFVYSVKLNGKKAALFNTALLPCILFYTLFYAGYHHFGVTNLITNAIGNQITLESIVFGFVRGVMAASVLMWFSCIHAVVSADKIMYLTGRVVPKGSLFLSMLLRMIPRIKQQAAVIHIAQQGIGKGLRQGSFLQRSRNFFRMASILITWLPENFAQTAQAMKSRGYTLKGRTAFSVYRFDGRDRSFVIVIFACVSVLLTGVLLDQTRILYNPAIILNRITPLSYLFYAVYAFLCCLPLVLQMMGEQKLKFIQIQSMRFSAEQVCTPLRRL
ncbi:MAG: energy-coupling factor transporter transmembrane component T [Ruthenibacterium sp.]